MYTKEEYKELEREFCTHISLVLRSNWKELNYDLFDHYKMIPYLKELVKDRSVIFKIIEENLQIAFLVSEYLPNKITSLVYSNKPKENFYRYLNRYNINNRIISVQVVEDSGPYLREVSYEDALGKENYTVLYHYLNNKETIYHCLEFGLSLEYDLKKNREELKALSKSNN